MVRDSTTLESLQSGRHVRHSRRGCTLCKERRIRCSEERPACAKCAKDGRSCEYVLRLTWEDESTARGVRHGRSASDSRLSNRLPSLELVNVKQDVPQDYGFYFINTNASDFGTSAIHQLPMSYESHRRAFVPQIFRSLETYDLDDIDRLLFQHYHSQVCMDLTLVDDMSNGYRYIVMPMSMTYGSVMQSILAVSALYLSLKQSSPSIDYYALALRHKQKTLNSLRQEIASLNGRTNDHILISMLMLCLLDITDNCQTSWPTHLSAAAKLISSQATTYDPSLSSFVSKFFAARDVMSRTACGARSKFKEIAWHNPHEIDNTIGCSYELIEIISSITDLVRHRTDINRDGPVIEQRLLAIETKLETLVQLMLTSSASLPATETIILLRTSSLIHTAAKIYFYTALHSATALTPLIQTLARQQIDLISGLPDLRSAHLWSIFVTALYVGYDEDRIFFLRQFERLEAASAAVGQTVAARAVVETVWKRRDLEANMPMPDGGKGERSDWERLVRPMSEGISLA